MRSITIAGLLVISIFSHSAHAECNLRPDDISDIEKAIVNLEEAWKQVNEGNIGFWSNYKDKRGQEKWKQHLNSWKPRLESARRDLNQEISTAKKYCN